MFQQTLRNDGRTADQLRNLKILQGINDSDGSAYFQLGSTKIATSITLCSSSSITVNPPNTELTSRMENLFLKFYDNIAQINITILQRDGSEFSCVVNCIALALSDAGIPMDDYLFSLGMCIYNSHSENKEILMDPNYLEEQSGNSISWVISGGKIVGFYAKDPANVDLSLKSMSKFNVLFEFEQTIRLCLKSHVSSVLKRRGNLDYMAK
eukprot:NODE_625_length_5289_cov_0.416956.p3 type:complete len:210 gc:universal NODE_625_length_5289_cov_0.416956:1940-1311(-)